ncbi:MAG: T9SS type A sorting domain-containing protein [Ignavibacteria bacterium]|nr:T9SS type A sorting domain-containing protein [Ignavibacteria bacterium]
MNKYILIFMVLSIFIVSGLYSQDGNNRYLSSGTSELEAAGNSTGPSDDYKLYQNYPNPFNPTTKITYKIKKEGNVYLSVFNLVGKEIAVLVNEFKTPGEYEVEFNAQDLPSGIYLYKLQINGYVSVKRMTLLR